jgi:hypothetical protein
MNRILFYSRIQAGIRLLLLACLIRGLIFAFPVRAGSAELKNSLVSAGMLGGCQLFPSNNIWNTRVDNLPVHARSDQWINTIGRSTGFHMDFGSGTWDGGPIGIPFNIVGSGGPKVSVSFYYPGESDPGPYPIPNNPLTEYGSDHHILIVDNNTCTLYELFDASYSGGHWHAGSGAIWYLNSNALRPDTWTSADAAGLPILPGLVRYDEVVSGQINHAIRFTAASTNNYIWPARHLTSNNPNAPQIPPMGARFRLKASYNISGYPAAMQVILQAMKTYGIILADNGSNWYVSGSPDTHWDNDMLHLLDRMTGNDFEAVDTSSLMVDYDSGSTGYTISGNAGGPGVKMSYVIGGLNKSVWSQANGNYTLQVPNDWGGTVTPSLACYTFNPIGRDYNNISANQTGQDYSRTYNTAEGCTNVNVSIGGVVQGGYYAQPGEVLVKSYAGLQNGPVKVKSPDNSALFASERVISGTSFNEVMGYPTDQLTTEYWFPWYDNIDMTTWVLVGNPTSSTAAVDIYVGGVKRTTQTIPPNGRITPRFNLQTGPVRVVSTNGVKIFTSERAVYKDAFNEVMGYPARQFTTEYWFPWYDNKSMTTWILVGNPSTTSTAAVDIYVGGVKRGSYSIPKGGRITPRFDLQTGPVRVVSTNGVKIFSSERTISGDSFNEVMGYPSNQFTTEYWYTWYDNVSMATWVLVGNPTTSTANVDIYIGGVKQGSYSIGTGKQINQRFSLNTGPVRVVSTNGVKIFSSERVLLGTSFNEVMGYPGNQLSTEYWFPWYDNTSMSTDILVGRP